MEQASARHLLLFLLVVIQGRAIIIPISSIRKLRHREVQ